MNANKLFSKKASATFGIALLAVGIFIAIPRVIAAAPVSAADNSFMMAVNQGNMAEMQLGELAATAGKRGEVRAFGRRMVKDQTSMNDALKLLAAQKGVTLHAGLNGQKELEMDKLSSLTDSQFDTAYIDVMIKEHMKAVNAFKAESAATTDADIKSFVDKNLPTVEEHLKLITAMKK